MEQHQTNFGKYISFCIPSTKLRKYVAHTLLPFTIIIIIIALNLFSSDYKGFQVCLCVDDDH